MRVFIDTEFIEDGKTIEPLSIGLVREDGAEYYAEPAETDRSKANDWVVQNVFPWLDGPRKPRHVIANELIHFVGKDPEFWAYYADYDWVVLCQLYGRMLDLPTGWPMFCMDLKQEIHIIGNPKLPLQDDVEHHALADARWNFKVWKWLTEEPHPFE